MSTEDGMRRAGGGIDLDETYLYLEGSAADVIEVTPTFWQELMADDARSPGAKRVVEGHGWLMMRFAMTSSPGHWEMHPMGDEILVLQAGRLDVVFDEVGGLRVVALQAGETCVVPRGVWHRQVVHSASSLIAITFGEGTRHRPISSESA